MPSDELMGRNKYAKHHGVSPNAVLKAARDGRIARAVVWGKGGRIVGIRWRLADQLWLQNTDPGEAAKSRRSPGPAAAASQPSSVQTSAPQASPARQIGQLLGEVFADSLPAWAAVLMTRHHIDAGVALEIVESGLLVMGVAAADRLGTDADTFKVLVDRELENAAHAETRPAVIERIQACAKAFGEANDQASK